MTWFFMVEKNCTGKCCRPGMVMTGPYYEKVFTESEICINIIVDTSSASDPGVTFQHRPSTFKSRDSCKDGIRHS